MSQRRAEERSLGQVALFGDAQEAPLKVRATPWSSGDRLQREFDAIGFFLSGHPLEAHEAVIKRMGAVRWAEFAARVRAGETTRRLAANVLDRMERRTKSGKKMGIIQLSDPSGQYEAVLFEEGLAQYRDLLEKGADVLVTLNARLDGEDVRAQIVHAEKLSEAAARSHKGLRVFLRDETPLPSIAERLRGRGDGEISLVVMLGAGGRRGRSPPARPLRRHRRARRGAEGGGRRGAGGARIGDAADLALVRARRSREPEDDRRGRRDGRRHRSA